MGTCGQCQTRLIQGQIERIKHYDFSIGQADRLRGYFLSCSYTAASPAVVIEALEARSSEDIPPQHISARVKSITQVNRDIAIISVQTPRSNRLRFLPGQNVRLTLDNETSVDLPVASCPCNDRNLEFHVRRLPGDAFSRYLFEQPSLPFPIAIDGPWGQAGQRIVNGSTFCLGFDTHIAAIKSWIEQQLADEAEHGINLYWFAPENEFYLSKLFSSWRDAFDSFTFDLIPAMNPELDSDESDRLRNALQHYKPELILVAGPERFVDRVRRCINLIDLNKYTLWIHSLATAS